MTSGVTVAVLVLSLAGCGSVGPETAVEAPGGAGGAAPDAGAAGGGGLIGAAGASGGAGGAGLATGGAGGGSLASGSGGAAGERRDAGSVSDAATSCTAPLPPMGFCSQDKQCQSGVCAPTTAGVPVDASEVSGACTFCSGPGGSSVCPVLYACTNSGWTPAKIVLCAPATCMIGYRCAICDDGDHVPTSGTSCLAGDGVTACVRTCSDCGGTLAADDATSAKGAL